MYMYGTAIAAAAKAAEFASRAEEEASGKRASILTAMQAGVTAKVEEEEDSRKGAECEKDACMDAGAKGVLGGGELGAADMSTTGDVGMVSADSTIRDLEAGGSEFHSSQTAQTWRNETKTGGEINVQLSLSREVEERRFRDLEEGAGADGGMSEVDVVLSVMQEEVGRWISSSQLAVLSLEKEMKASGGNHSKQVRFSTLALALESFPDI